MLLQRRRRCTLDPLIGETLLPAPYRRPADAGVRRDPLHRFLLNLAAYTAVDRAESEPEVAWAVNYAGAAHVAAACEESATPLIHLSTDYVFDGRKTEAYLEDDPVGPLNVYGRTKEAGERAVRAALARHVIVRTAWVFGAYGANFVKTILRLEPSDRSLRIVAD